MLGGGGAASQDTGQSQDKDAGAEKDIEADLEETHIYDNAIVKDIMNGTHTEKIGEYSIVEAESDEVTEDAIADWYFNYVEKNDFNWCMILYTDRKNKGVYAITGIINKDVSFDTDEYGDYSLGDSSKSITYIPAENGALKELHTEAEKTTTKSVNNSEEKNISAYELISMEGHPVLYDFLSTAHTFWDNYAEKRIDFPDDYFDDFQAEKTVLVIDAWLSLEHGFNEHMIRGFEIYPDKEISLDEGLNLAKSYLPMDILKKWYALEWSKCYYSEEDNVYQYYVLYEPTESGKENIDKQGLDYNYAGVSLTVQNDVVIGLSVISTNPLGRHTDGHEIDWKYDFLN